MDLAINKKKIYFIKLGFTKTVLERLKKSLSIRWMAPKAMLYDFRIPVIPTARSSFSHCGSLPKTLVEDFGFRTDHEKS